MRILALETSCDDSAVTWLEVRGGEIVRLERAVASQAIHAKYGGVVPEVAAREHSAMIPPLLDELASLVTGQTNGATLAEVTDAVAATSGPGLVTSLRVGLDTGRALAAAWGKDFYAINHVEAHIYANWLPGVDDGGMSDRAFPALALVVSGGHTELLLMSGHGEYRLLGSTRDDAAGEAFDKTAKLMGLGYPGGPKISQAAAYGDPAKYDFPRPMIDSGDFNFSFSGLKTAVRYFIEKNRPRLEDMDFMSDLAASVEQAIVDVLVKKTVAAARDSGVKTVLLAGGVAANGKLRQAMREALAAEVPAAEFVEPELAYCTDNASMIAITAYFASLRRGPDDWRTVEADPNWEIGR